VAALAAAAAGLWRLSEADVLTVRRAGLLHGLGRLGVSNSTWDKRGPLTSSEREHVRLQPYLTERMLTHVDALSASRRVAARYQERLDGSGYPRGLTASALQPVDRLLAAANAYHAMTEPRAYRQPLTPDQIATALAADVREGRLDGAAVGAVLTAAGRRRSIRRAWPEGLTSREVDVLAPSSPGDCPTGRSPTGS
jgi:HD-GYP domain-containing protein (c-di-GMP phosphodiesterase class II)